MSSPIYTRKLFESRGLPSPCRYPNCGAEKYREETPKKSGEESPIMKPLMDSDKEEYEHGR